MAPGARTHQYAEVLPPQKPTPKALTLIFVTEIQCKDPDTFANVNYSVSTHSVGGVAQYYCPRGHTMQGNATRICLKKGVWGGQAPSCLRKLSSVSNQ